MLVGAVIVPVVGWFVGVVLLWVSKAWTTGEKWLGTLVVPGGLATVLLVGLLAPLTAPICTTTISGVQVGVDEFVPAAEEPEVPGRPPPEPAPPRPAPEFDVETTECSGAPPWLMIPIALIVLIAPILVAVHLLRVAGRRPAPA